MIYGTKQVREIEIWFIYRFVLTDASVMPLFKVGTDPRNDWLKWKRAFDRLLTANEIVNDEERFNLLLVLGGIELQTYFDKVDKVEVDIALDENSEIHIPKYDSAVVAIDSHFAPQLNKRFERH